MSGELNYINEKDGKFEVLVEGDYYRVTTIDKVIGVNKQHKLIVKHMPISYGLNIEEKLNGATVVVTTLEWNSETQEPVLEDVCLKSWGNTKSGNNQKFEEYMNSVDFARQAIIDVHEND